MSWQNPDYSGKKSKTQLFTVFSSPIQVQTFLSSIPMFKDHGAGAANFSLDAIRGFCEFMGNPQWNYAVVHVAGTNGKGTVCHLLASVLQEAGFKTGLYTSPHLNDYSERFRINGLTVPDEELFVFFNLYADEVTRRRLTYFEISTALAFWYFDRRKVDMAVIETGLGGRLDATNIVKPELSVITSIGKDHTEILGDSIAAIAAEKAGIIKKKTPVVTGNLPDEALKVVQQYAAGNASVVHKAPEVIIQNEENSPRFLTFWNGATKLRFKSVLLNSANRVNYAIVLKAVDILRKKRDISMENVTAGFEKVFENTGLAGRFEKIHPEYNWYYDGAHNAEALGYLIQTLHEQKFNRPWIFVFNIMKDKLTGDFKELLSEFDELYYFTTDNKRAARFEEVNARISDVHLLSDKPFSRFKSALVIFSGSFYFYSTIKGYFTQKGLKKDKTSSSF